MKEPILWDTLTITGTYLLLRFVEMFHKVICCLPHVLLHFNRQNFWRQKNSNNQTQLKTQNKEWMLTNQRHRTHGWTENYYREQDVSAWDMRYRQVGQLLCWRMLCVRERTASAQWSQHSPDTLGRRGQLWRRPCPPASVLLSTRWHQMSDQNPLQAAIAHTFPQPSTTREPGNRETPFPYRLKTTLQRWRGWSLTTLRNSKTHDTTEPNLCWFNSMSFDIEEYQCC